MNEESLKTYDVRIVISVTVDAKDISAAADIATDMTRYGSTYYGLENRNPRCWGINMQVTELQKPQAVPTDIVPLTANVELQGSVSTNEPPTQPDAPVKELREQLKAAAEDFYVVTNKPTEGF